MFSVVTICFSFIIGKVAELISVVISDTMVSALKFTD